MAGEAHPVPSRTRKLSPRAPMVLRGKPVGEQDVADRRRAFRRKHRGEAPRREARGLLAFPRPAGGRRAPMCGDAVEGRILAHGRPPRAYSDSSRGATRAANLENRILRSMRSTRQTSEIASPRRDRGNQEAPDISYFVSSEISGSPAGRNRRPRGVDSTRPGAWRRLSERRVRSWLRMNAGGALNTCKSNG